MNRQPTVAIIGAGMSGICMAVKLRMAGVTDFTIFEKSDRLGGTWRDNTYPGLYCDVPSHFYQYSFAPNPGWSHQFSPGGEIREYLDDVAERFELEPHCRFGVEVVRAEYASFRWRVTTSDGAERDFDFLISASGVLHHPVYPDIEGLDRFAGAAFHSARWDHSVALEGKRIGVLGNGSTGVQIVSALSKVAERLFVFQRTPQWILPLPNWRNPLGLIEAHRRFPLLGRLDAEFSRLSFELFSRALTRPGWQRSLIAAVCRRHLESIEDPELRKLLTPHYEPMCKRLVISSSFYQAMQRRNVELVSGPIASVTPDSVLIEDGRAHEVDVLVLATGFDAHAYMRPIELVGENGVTLAEAWRSGPRAYRTVALPGFPNFFMLMGPHSPIGNYSLVPIAETQADYARRWIEAWRRGEFDAAAPTAGATESFNYRMREAMPNTVWMTGCQSWYLDAEGRPEIWPWEPQRHREMLREPRWGDFEISRLEPERDVTAPLLS